MIEGELKLRIIQHSGSLTTLTQRDNMDTMNEMIPFAKEMLHQRPSRSMVKIYMLGTTLAFLGAVSGLVESVCLPFSEKEVVDEVVTKMVAMTKVEEEQKSQIPEKPVEEVKAEELEEDVLEMTDIEDKARQLVGLGQRRRSRSYAS